MPPSHGLDIASTYVAFGLRIRSRIPLPELGPPIVGEDLPPDVEIRLGKIPEPTGPPDGVGPALQVFGDAARLEFPEARYWVKAGSEIVVEPAAGASERDVRVYLLGSVIGALCQQRGMLLLHANAIEIDGRAVAFVGPSGAGKSTLAAYFHLHGRRVLCDDVCRVSIDADGRALAWSGIPRIKLWRDALDAFRIGEAGLERVSDVLDKFSLPTPHDPSRAPLPLTRIYALGETTECLLSIRGIFGAEAVGAIMRNTYRPEYLRPLGRSAAQFEKAVGVAKAAGVYAVSRRWGLDVFSTDVETILHHVAKLRVDRGA